MLPKIDLRESKNEVVVDTPPVETPLTMKVIRTTVHINHPVVYRPSLAYAPLGLSTAVLSVTDQI